MAHPALSAQTSSRFGFLPIGRLGQMLLFSFVLLGAGLYVPDGALEAVLVTVAITFLIAIGLHLFQSRSRRRQMSGQDASLMQVILQDASPSFATDLDGAIVMRNPAAEERFGPGEGKGDDTLTRSLRDLFANPGALLLRLQSRAEARGAAREDVVTRKGHVRLSVHRVTEERFLWRFEDLVERSSSSRGAEGLSLPMLTTSRSGTILFMNDAMRRVIGSRVKTLDRVFGQMPQTLSGVHEVLGADGPLRAQVVEIEGAGGRREIYLIPVQENAAPEMTVPVVQPAAFDSLPVALVQMTRDGELRALNSQAREFLGPLAEPGVDLSTLVEGLGRSVRDWLEEAADGKGVMQAEIVRASQPDKEIYLQITLGRVATADDVQLLAVLNDATELKTLEAQFVQSQKMHAIGQLAGGVAHDFNNLLTAISGHCDLLLLRHDQGDPDFGDLVQINQNANRAASLVRQLLAFSRKQTLQPEILDLSDTLSDLTHLLNRLVGERVRLTLWHGQGLRAIRADKRQLEQVIMNLVVNARDAMPDGGDIRIETEARHLESPLRRDRATVPAGDYIVVRVVDTGIGIPSDKLQKIFEPFFSTKRTGEGTGLGLSTAYGIIKQTGGFIFADSVSGIGSTFSLFLPVHEGPLPERTASVENVQKTNTMKGEGVVLLVEDEAPVRAFASRALRLRGYTVIEAENAEDALGVLQDPSLRVDVFVTDVIMPGMDGPTWVRMALKERPDARVVFVSGYAQDSFADAQARIPNSVFLPKPFSLNELTTTVQTQIH